MIERGHFTISISLLKHLAEKQPEELLMRAGGRDLGGPALIDYLNRQPSTRKWISDCPQAGPDGACGCHA